MAHAEASTNADIIFRGINGNECEAFIVAIRDLAFAKGKEGDDYWMLHYATTRLRGKALRWHAKLDPSIRKDWDLLVQAMFDEYPSTEEGDAGGIATPVWNSMASSPAPSIATLPGNSRLPTAAQPEGEEGLLRGPVEMQGHSLEDGPATTPQIYHPLLPGYKVGRLRVVYEEGGAGAYYVNCGQPDSVSDPDLKNITANIHDALVVIFTSSSEPHQIGCTNSRKVETWNLGIKLFSSKSSEFHPLVGTQYVTVPSSQIMSYKGYKHFRVVFDISHVLPDETPHATLASGIFVPQEQFQTVSNIWNVLPDGTIRATLADLEGSDDRGSRLEPSDTYSTATAYAEIPGPTISFVKDDSVTPAFHPSGRPIVRVRIVFEPI